MKIKDVMSREVVHATPLTTIERAAQLMRDKQVGLLPIVEQGRLVGCVTDRDLVVRGIAGGKDGWFSRLADVMTEKTYCCLETHELDACAALMALHRVRRLMVTDDSGALTGVVSMADIAARRDAEARPKVREISVAAAGLPVAA